MEIEQIAQVAHETNKTYCSLIGDLTQLPWNKAPEWQKKSAINGVKFHMSELEKGNHPLPSASHDSWLAEKEKDGWKYGPIKDVVKKEHPCFVSYDQLPSEQKTKDFLFSAIVEAFYRSSKF